MVGVKVSRYLEPERVWLLSPAFQALGGRAPSPVFVHGARKRGGPDASWRRPKGKGKEKRPDSESGPFLPLSSRFLAGGRLALWQAGRLPFALDGRGRPSSQFWGIPCAWDGRGGRPPSPGGAFAITCNSRP